MKNSRIILVSSAVVFSLMLGNLNAFAATPAQNNLQVQKALNSLKQGLESHKANIQIVVGNSQAQLVTATPKPVAKPVTAVKYNRSKFNQNMPQPVINSILVSPDSVTIGYDGIINYNIIRETPKIFVIDIINPVYTVGAENYKPDQNGDILNAVVAYYTNRSMYGYPYLRMTVYLKKQVPYALGSSDGSFVIYFGNNIQQEINQQQQLNQNAVNAQVPLQPNMLPVVSNVANTVPASVTANNTTVPNNPSINTQQPITLELMKKINLLEDQIKAMKEQQELSNNNAVAEPQTNSALKNEFNSQNNQTQQSPVKQAKTIDISLKNISCIKSPYLVKQVIYSKEDSLQIQVVGNDVFVKILPLKIQNYDGSYKYKYSSTPRDIYIVTDSKTFSLNLVPKDEPAVTYYLSQEQQSPAQSKMANLQARLERKQIEFAQNQPFNTSSTSFYSQGAGNEYTNNLIDLIKSAYIGKTPSGYILMPNNFKKEYSELTIKGEYKFVGQSSIIYVYKIIPKENLNIDPSQFVWLVPKPMAATVINTQPKANETTQLVVVGAP